MVGPLCHSTPVRSAYSKAPIANRTGNKTNEHALDLSPIPTYNTSAMTNAPYRPFRSTVHKNIRPIDYAQVPNAPVKTAPCRHRSIFGSHNTKSLSLDKKQVRFVRMDPVSSESAPPVRPIHDSTKTENITENADKVAPVPPEVASVKQEAAVEDKKNISDELLERTAEERNKQFEDSKRHVFMEKVCRDKAMEEAERETRRREACEAQEQRNSCLRAAWERFEREKAANENAVRSQGLTFRVNRIPSTEAMEIDETPPMHMEVDQDSYFNESHFMDWTSN